jgi:hypothetical protein
MTDGYGSHKNYMALVDEEARARETVFERALPRMSTFVLADAIVKQPAILKPIIAAYNIGARAIERDLGIRNMDTYNPRVIRDQGQGGQYWGGKRWLARRECACAQ